MYFVFVCLQNDMVYIWNTYLPIEVSKEILFACAAL